MNKFIKVTMLLMITIFSSNQINIASESFNSKSEKNKPKTSVFSNIFNGGKRLVNVARGNIFLRDLVKKIDQLKKLINEIIKKGLFHDPVKGEQVKKAIEEINGIIYKYGDKALSIKYCPLPRMFYIDESRANSLLDKLNSMGKRPCGSMKDITAAKRDIDDTISSLKNSLKVLLSDKKTNPMLKGYGNNDTNDVLLKKEEGSSIRNSVIKINEWIEKNPGIAKSDNYCRLPTPPVGHDNTLKVDYGFIRTLDILLNNMKDSPCRDKQKK